MTKMIHSMIRVSNLDKSIAFYRDALELEIKDQFVFDTFTLTYLANKTTGFELELTYNHLRDLGIAPSDVKAMDHNQKHLATFFFITDPDGYKIEFLQRQGRYQ